MSTVHLEVRVGASRRQAKLAIDRETGVVQLRFHREHRKYVGHVSELAECLYNMRCRELAREELHRKALERAQRRAGVLR